MPPRPARRPARQRSRRHSRRGLAWASLATEVVALLAAAMVAEVALLGTGVAWLSGAGSAPRLIPFVGVVLLLGALTAGFFWLWVRLHGWLRPFGVLWPAVAALVPAGLSVWHAQTPAFTRAASGLRTLVGGSAEAERVAIEHQVYAAYRRTDLVQMLRVIERARVFAPTVREAAAAFDVDPEVLMGVGAAESAFYPRDSADGGRGLFQITAPPAVATAAARQRLGADHLDPLNQRHNAFVAAATLHNYLAEMHGDLFLGLLAYNIGPHNGGLRSIMRQYGARDFITIQPYLQHLPRDYPIRVLCAALAYRLWHVQGRLPRYEEGDNALRVQRVGIPGLEKIPSLKMQEPLP
ncbi:MAG: transglycosylase SLT domain-containing protein [Candidatus Binatia bacterium]